MSLFRVSASLSVGDFLDRAGLPEDTVETDMTSVGGWVMELLGRIPEQNEFVRSGMFDMTVQSQQGWQRSRLYMEYDNIWDATSFAATMNATLACGPDDKGRVYTFTSCEEADRSVYEYLTFDQVAVCRKNVEDFYADPKTQMRWKDVILHPVSLILRGDGSLEPVAISKLDPSILDRYEKTSVCIGDRESYNWIFEK